MSPLDFSLYNFKNQNKHIDNKQTSKKVIDQKINFYTYEIMGSKTTILYDQVKKYITRENFIII